jgi:membrane-associated protease RseP (regulator of RpoE activity)
VPDHQKQDADLRMLYPEEHPEVIKEVMDVKVATEEGGLSMYRGYLKRPPDEAFGILKKYSSSRYLPFMQRDDQLEAQIALLPNLVAEHNLKHPIRPWLHWLLFVLTLITTTIAGARLAGVDVFAEPDKWLLGVPFSLSLLSILGLHEAGHYVIGRMNGMDVSPPFFMPVPFWLGTFGAFIQMRSPSESRKMLFDTSVAGPLAGLAVAVPVLYYGLMISHPGSMNLPADSLLAPTTSTSIMFGLIANFAMPDVGFGQPINLHPVAFAGWLGLLITALNLVPVGELDGGHVAKAMFGQRGGRFVNWVAMAALLYAGIFIWPSILLFALIVIIFAGRGAPPLNDISRLGPGRMLIGAFSFAVLAAILTPMPAALWKLIG